MASLRRLGQSDGMDSPATSLPIRMLAQVAMYGRSCLVLGLLAGLALPGLAQAITPALPMLVALLLFFTAFRLGAGQVLGDLSLSFGPVAQAVILQAAVPLACLACLLLLQVEIGPFLLAVTLMLSAPSVTGAPNFAIMNRVDPAPAMRLLVVGTALFPVLVLPIFGLLPQLGGTEGLRASVTLVVVILVSVGGGFALRRVFDAQIGPSQERALDGVTAIALAVIVVGLMSALGPLLREDPLRLARWVIAVFIVNIGLQVLVFYVYRGGGRIALSMIAGNRNVALFLIALPEHVIEPLLIFIGCYQIPMYLTPLIMKPLHDRA